MPLEEKITIPEDQVHSGGTVDATSKHVIPVEDKYYPWLHGTKPDWMSKDSHVNYADVNGSYSMMSKGARHIKVSLESVFSNSRRHHDWKGYDDIEPTGFTRVAFNDRQVGIVRGYGGDILRHLVQVHRYIEDLQNLGQFGWFSDEDLQKVIGKQVDYDGYPGVVVETLNTSGEIVVYCPTWPDDGYDRGGRLRAPALYEKINWYPDPNRPEVKPTDPYVGPDFVEFEASYEKVEE